MSTPLLHRQLQEQLSQFIHPKDKRHLSVFSENVAALLLSESSCLSRWIKYLTHRNCQARSHLERLSYFVNNPNITPETYYHP
ncbi:MAG: IS4 family transposase, partial [Cyanobacteria bacterium P01_E01_bin.6]